MRRRVLRSVRPCVPRRSIRPVTRACRAMPAAMSASSTVSMGRMYSPTATPISAARARSTSTRCGFRHASCGAKQHRRAMRSTSICGMTISSLREPMSDPEPVFAEPWEAHAFALAVKLSEAGLFTWSEWSAALAEELADARRRREPDDGSRYYHRWLAALERLVASKKLVAPPSLRARKEEWAEAYRRTPHRTPLTLE